MKFEKTNYLNMYYACIDDKPYIIDKMKVYDESGVICEGDFARTSTGVKFNLPDVVELNIGEVKRKLKVNFAIKDSYIAKSKDSNCFYDVQYDLYIHKDTINLQEPLYKKYTDHIQITRYANDGIEFESYDFSISRAYKEKYKEIRELGEKLSKSWLKDSELEQLVSQISTKLYEVLDEKEMMDNFTIEDYLAING